MAIKKLLPLALLLLLTISLQAQYKPVVLGLRGGINLGWLKSPEDNYETLGMRTGFDWGFIAEFYFMENYAVQTGFNMQYLAGKMEFPYAKSMDTSGVLVPGTLTRAYRFNYLQIPVVIKMKANLSERFNFFGKVGLGTGFRLDARADDEFAYGNDEVFESESNIRDEISLVRASLILGIGAEYVLKGSTVLILEFTFDNGFTDILNESNPAYPDEDQKAISSLMGLGVGIVF